MKVGILGLGNMGWLFFKAMKKQDTFSIKVYDHNPKVLEKLPNIYLLSSYEELIAFSELLIICIKPQDFFSLRSLPTFSGYCVLSIMAGVLCKDLSQSTGCFSIARAMPNWGIGVQKGVTGLFFTPQVPAEFRDRLFSLFSNLGFCLQVDEEEKLDSLTALSGSGPAYFLQMAKVLVEKARSLGFSEKESQRLIIYTLTGTARGLERSGFLPAGILKSICSKGGTTQAALDSLEEENFSKVLSHAVDRALARSKELKDAL